MAHAGCNVRGLEDRRHPRPRRNIGRLAFLRASRYLEAGSLQQDRGNDKHRAQRPPTGQENGRLLPSYQHCHERQIGIQHPLARTGSFPIQRSQYCLPSASTCPRGIDLELYSGRGRSMNFRTSSSGSFPTTSRPCLDGRQPDAASACIERMTLALSGKTSPGVPGAGRPGFTYRGAGSGECFFDACYRSKTSLNTSSTRTRTSSAPASVWESPGLTGWSTDRGSPSMSSSRPSESQTSIASEPGPR